MVFSNPSRTDKQEGCPRQDDTLKSSNVGPVTFYTWNAVGIGTLPDDFDVRRTASTRHSVQRTNHERTTGWHVIVSTTAPPSQTHAILRRRSCSRDSEFKSMRLLLQGPDADRIIDEGGPGCSGTSAFADSERWSA